MRELELLFKVKEQIVEHLTTDKKPVENSKNYLYSKFEFSEDWQGIKKTALFTSAKGVTKRQILDENNMCEVPWEVIAYPHFSVSVFGGDLITANRCVVDILKSGYCEGTAPKEPTPDVYAQILDKVGKTVEIAENLVEGEKIRVKSETDRVEAERNRITAEDNRATSESIRATSESIRAEAEEQRVINEQNRVEAENKRATLTEDLETLKQETETVKENATNATKNATQATEKANEAATHQPIIGNNKNWFVWDIEQRKYIDTGVRGEVTISQTTGDSENDVMSQKATTEALLILSNKVAPSPASVTIYADRWEQDEDEKRWHQVVEVANATITPRSKVDLQLNAEQIAIFYEKSLAFVAENEDSVVTVYCIGQVPENDYTIQATVSEVVVNG